MSNGALDPSASPSELNDPPRARRLSKLPAMIIMGVALLVVSLLGYSILTRGQPKEVVAEDDESSEEIQTTLFSANDIIQGQDKSLFERPILPKKEPAKDPKSEIPELSPKIIEVEKVPVPVRSVRSNAPTPIRSNTDVATMTPEEKFEEKVARAKEQLLLDALVARTFAVSAPDVKEEDTKTNSTASVAPSAGRDRAREKREIREGLAAQQQTSPELERISSLLSTIAENTSRQSNQQSNQHTTSPRRLTGMEALASLQQGNKGGLALRPANNNALYQGGLASRPASNNALSSLYQNNSLTLRPANNNALYQGATPQTVGIGQLSQTQKDLLVLAENSPAGTFIQAKREYGYSTEATREQLTDTDLRVGTIIPAILINGINSELEGVAIAQVSQNVWDSTHGENVLIPQGTRLIGDFKSDIKEGQSRVGVSWNRLQFPDGKTLALTNMVGSDQAGFTGFSDMVNNHYKKKFGSATLLSIISGLGSMFASDNEKQTSGESFTNQLAQQYGTVGSSMIEKNLEIPPTIIIRPGYRFNVIVTQDFALKPYYE